MKPRDRRATRIFVAIDPPRVSWVQSLKESPNVPREDDDEVRRPNATRMLRTPETGAARCATMGSARPLGETCCCGGATMEMY
jgi:hypothetical protein